MNRHKPICHPERLHYGLELCHSCYSTNYAKKWRGARPQKTKERYRRYSLKYRYGINQEDYDIMFLSQRGVCAVCNLPSKRKYLPIDHNHKTKRIRGLLCDLCNAFVGKIDKDSETFIRLALYYGNNDAS